MKIIERTDVSQELINSIKHFPITAMLGPRQCGKSTLAREMALKFPKSHFLDMEDIVDLERLRNMKLALDPLEGLIIIDEIQRKPELFPYLRVLVDRFPDRRYLILGSASRDLIEKASETLAGRVHYIELTPFSLSETNDAKKLLERGGFPRSFLAPNDSISVTWRKDYIQSYLERDLPQLGIKLPSADLYRFWMMLAHYHGNTVNYSEIGGSLGISDNTVRRYVALLEDTFMIRYLQPWRENIAKRQVKSPKLYIRDIGLLRNLLGIGIGALESHPKLGALWEGFAIEEIVRAKKLRKEECYFWDMSGKAELDLLSFQDDKKEGFEIKYSDHPKASKSMHIAMEYLRLKELKVITPVDTRYHIDEEIEVIGLERFIRSI